MHAPNSPIAIPTSSNGCGITISLTAVAMLNMTVLRLVRAETAPMGPSVMALLIIDRPTMLTMLPRVPMRRSLGLKSGSSSLVSKIENRKRPAQK